MLCFLGFFALCYLMEVFISGGTFPLTTVLCVVLQNAQVLAGRSGCAISGIVPQPRAGGLRKEKIQGDFFVAFLGR